MTRNRSRGRRGRKPGQGDGEGSVDGGEPVSQSPSTEAPSRSALQPQAAGESQPDGEKQSRSGRRRRRGRGSGAGAPQNAQVVQPDVATETRPERAVRPGAGERPDRQRQGSPRPNAADQGGDGRSGGASRRRRNARRRAPQPAMPDSVLKETAPEPVPARPMVMRRLDQIGDGNEVTLGCPMLSRTRIALHTNEGLRAGRCSLGWAVHGEDEVRFCLHTPSSLECWKAHPERIEGILAELSEEAQDEPTPDAAD